MKTPWLSDLEFWVQCQQPELLLGSLGYWMEVGGCPCTPVPVTRDQGKDPPALHIHLPNGDCVGPQRDALEAFKTTTGSLF